MPFIELAPAFVDEEVHGGIAKQIIQLLTGLSEERIHPLGGVIFRDPVTERNLPRTD